MSSDRLLYHFVALIVEHLKFDRATLVIYLQKEPSRNEPSARRSATTPSRSIRSPSRGPQADQRHPLGAWRCPRHLDSDQPGHPSAGPLLADNIYSLEKPPADAVQSLIDLTGQVALTLENARLLERLQVMALRDDLTGLFRPGYFYERLQEELLRMEREAADGSIGLCGPR